MTPKIHMTAFLDRPGQFVFVAVPDEVGRYLRTDKSVVLVDCTHCGAALGEPCFHRNKKYGGTTHVHRRVKAKRLFGYSAPFDDLLHDEPMSPHHPSLDDYLRFSA